MALMIGVTLQIGVTAYELPTRTAASVMTASCCLSSLKATFHLTISVREKRAMGKIQRNNYHHGSCRPSLTGKTSSVSLIFTHGTHRNVKNR